MGITLQALDLHNMIAFYQKIRDIKQTHSDQPEQLTSLFNSLEAVNTLQSDESAEASDDVPAARIETLSKEIAQYIFYPALDFWKLLDSLIASPRTVTQEEIAQYVDNPNMQDWAGEKLAKTCSRFKAQIEALQKQKAGIPWQRQNLKPLLNSMAWQNPDQLARDIKRYLMEEVELNDVTGVSLSFLKVQGLIQKLIGPVNELHEGFGLLPARSAASFLRQTMDEVQQVDRLNEVEQYAASRISSNLIDRLREVEETYTKKARANRREAIHQLNESLETRMKAPDSEAEKLSSALQIAGQSQTDVHVAHQTKGFRARLFKAFGPCKKHEMPASRLEAMLEGALSEFRPLSR